MKRRNSRNVPELMQVFLLSLFCFVAEGALRAEDASAEKTAEAKQYEEEEKTELEKAGKLDLLYSDFSGKLTLFTKEQIEASGDGSVLGTFAIGTATHLVKLVTPEVEKALRKLDGKTCTLNAKLRNNGKYIYVRKVTQAGPGNDFVRRKGGL